MTIRWKNILLPLCAMLLIFSACRRQFSSDKPLPTSFTPSIIISSDNQVYYALDPATGLKNWQLSLPSIGGIIPLDFTPSPLLYNGTLYLTAINSDTIYKVNSKTGVVISKLTASNATQYNTPKGLFTVIATPTADANLLYVATTNDTLYAIDTATGIIKWRFGANAPLESSPVVYNGFVYFASTGGRVYSVDKTNGPDPVTFIPAWEYPSSDDLPVAKFVSSPAIAAPYLYIGSVSDSDMYCIYLTPPSPIGLSSTNIPINKTRWIYKTRGGIYSSPAAFAGRVLFGSNDFHVYCLDTALNLLTLNARKIWTDSLHSQIYSSPYVASSNSVAYIGCHDYFLYAINIIDGGIKWNFKTQGLVKSSPVEYNGLVYIASYDKNLYAVDSATGTVRWSYNTNGNIECSPVIDNLTGNNTIASQISGIRRQPNH